MMQRYLIMAFSLALCCMLIGLTLEGALAQRRPKIPPISLFRWNRVVPAR